MYKEHPSFLMPTDTNIKIWRYMNTDKFLDLITSGCLYFASADKLGDPMEDSYTKADISWLEKNLPELINKFNHHGGRSLPFYKINCWHMASEETLSMWRSYTDKGQGIVIQSTFSRFKDSLLKSTDDIYIGKVEYIDHYTYEVPQFGIDFNRFLKKDSSFSYESELRAIKYCSKIKDDRFDYNALSMRMDSLVEVDLSILIENIIVSQYMDEWLHEALQKAVQQFYPKMNIETSRLKKVPVLA